MNAETMESTDTLPLEESAAGTQLPTLSDLIMKMPDGKEILERSGLDKPETFKFPNSHGEVIYHVGKNVKGVRVVVSEEMYSSGNGELELPRWRATTIANEYFSDPEKRDQKLRGMGEKIKLLWTDDRIGTLVGYLTPRPPIEPVNGK